MAELLTIDEAAARLRCSPRQVRRLVDNGRLAAVVIGKRTRRIRPETLDQFIENSECLSDAPQTRDTRTSRGSPRFTQTRDELAAVLGLAPKPRHLRPIPGNGSSREESKKP